MATWKSNSYIVIGWKISHIIQDIIIGKCRPIITYSVHDISTTQQHLVIFPNLGGNEVPSKTKIQSLIFSRCGLDWIKDLFSKVFWDIKIYNSVFKI